MAELPTAVGGRTQLRLTVKEKVLLQLGEFLCERDLAEYPLELTQKGLAENLGVRRGHIATSLKSLLEDGMVEARKERVEGEQRRQNVYTLTPKGLVRAGELRETACGLEVEFESDGSLRQVRVQDLLKSTKLTLIMVVNQLERGGPVRDEITIVTRREKKLVSVFCPTCKRSIEVENIYIDEEVGFDCPGCGRPYRVSPAERVVGHVEKAEAGLGRLIAVIFLFFGAFAFGYAFMPPLFTLFLLLFVLFVGAFILGNRSRRKVPRKVTISAGIILVCFLAGFLLVFFWALFVESLSIVRQIVVVGPLLVGVVLGYMGTALRAPDLKGEFLLAAGLLLVLLAFLTLFVEDLGGLDLDSAPFLAVSAVTLLMLSTLHPGERDGKLLAAFFSSGVVLLISAFVLVLPSRENTLDSFVFGACVVLGSLMASLRLVQRWTSVSLAHQFLWSLPLSGGLGFVMVGAYMILGGSLVAGIVEIGIVAPFVMLGLERVFDGEWMYKVPIVAVIVGTEVLTIASVLLV